MKTIQIETMLLSWSSTHNGGAKIVLQVSDEDLEPFKSLTVKKGNHAGQRFMAVFAEMGDDEKLVEEAEAAPKAKTKRNGHGHFPDGLCGLAVKWSIDPDFLEWLWSEHGDTTYAVNEKLDDGAPLDALAGGTIKSLCGIASRKELDVDEEAKAKFNALIRLPYSAHRKEMGLP